MAQQRQRAFPSVPRPCLAQLAVMAVLMCAASTTTAQPQPQPLPLPQPTTTTTPAVPSLPAACPPAQATLSPCLNFFIGNSSSPPAECCAQIRAMFQSQAPCLCAAMSSAPAQLGLGSAFGQLLPSSCDLPANACSGGTTGGAPGGPTTTPAPGSSGTTAAAAAPESGPTGVDPAAASGGGGMKSVPGLVDSGAATAGYRGVSAAALFMSLFGVYLL